MSGSGVAFLRCQVAPPSDIMKMVVIISKLDIT